VEVEGLRKRGRGGGGKEMSGAEFSGADYGHRLTITPVSI